MKFKMVITRLKKIVKNNIFLFIIWFLLFAVLLLGIDFLFRYACYLKTPYFKAFTIALVISCGYFKSESIKGLFIIYNPEIEKNKVDTLNSTIDMLPTIANIFGLDGYDPNKYLGSDIFDKSSNHLVYFSDHSYTDGKIYSTHLTYEEYSKKMKYYDEIQEYVNKQIEYND